MIFIFNKYRLVINVNPRVTLLEFSLKRMKHRFPDQFKNELNVK